MELHKVINLNTDSHKINLEHVLVESLTTRERVEFGLIDGGVFYLNMEELWTAFNVLASDEFDVLTSHINCREDAWKDAQDAYLLMVGNEECTPKALYEYGECMKNYGRYAALVASMYSHIVNMVGHDAWVNACRMYESITGIPREWLS